MQSIELTGLDGRNPISYFAALGALLAANRMLDGVQPTLTWSTTPIPVPSLMVTTDQSGLVTLIDEDRRRWEDSPSLAPNFDDVKFTAEQQRDYLRHCRDADDDGRSAGLASALVAEGAFAGKGDGKPTDLHFTAGRKQFLVIARTLQREVTLDDIQEALFGPPRYDRPLPTLGWDVSDDRVDALSASTRGDLTRMTMPGTDWLALLGLAMFPVVAGDAQARPPGSEREWKRGGFRWPLWDVPLSAAAIRSLIPHAAEFPDDLDRVGVFQVIHATIRRSDRGGYGSFSPVTTHWERADRGRRDP